MKKNLIKENYNRSFLKFWEKYPLKKGKAKAYIAWQKISDIDQLFPTILLALENQKKEKQRKKDSSEFCPNWPHPATWLSQRRWEDEIEDFQEDAFRMFREKYQKTRNLV
ncbi:MAG: hypothetical protein JSW07_05360 [bacterium]|nr:MAG: hypothetical protein JSW07_05360 [bacterium]